MPEYGSEYENEGYKEKVKEKTTSLGEKVDSFNEKNENLGNKSSHNATREDRTDNPNEKDQDYKNFNSPGVHFPARPVCCWLFYILG